MKREVVFFIVIISVATLSVAFRQTNNSVVYLQCFTTKMSIFNDAQQKLLQTIQQSNIQSQADLEKKTTDPYCQVKFKRS